MNIFAHTDLHSLPLWQYINNGVCAAIYWLLSGEVEELKTGSFASCEVECICLIKKQ